MVRLRARFAPQFLPPITELPAHNFALPATTCSLTLSLAMGKISSMITPVTQKNMITIPAEVARHFGIKPGYRLDWQLVEGKDEILVRVIPERGELARRLLGTGRRFSPERDAVAELVAERAAAG